MVTEPDAKNSLPDNPKTRTGCSVEQMVRQNIERIR